MAKLTFVFDDGQDVVVPMHDRLTVGRAETNDVVVDDERISAQHAELILNADGSIQVFDLQSEAGTFVNDARVTSHTLLHGDRLAFGPLNARLDLELPPETARVTSKTVRVPLATTPDRERESNQAVRKAEQRLLLLDAAEKQALDAQEKWRQSLEELQKDHQAKTSDLEHLNAQIEKAAARLQEVENDEKSRLSLAEAARRECAELEVRAREAQKTAAEHEQRITDAKAEIQHLEERQNALQSTLREIEETQQKLTQAKTTYAEAEARQSALQVVLLRLDQSRESNEKNLSELEMRIAEAESRLAAVRREIDDENRRAEELRARIAQLEADHAAPLKALDHELAAAETELARLRGQTRPLRNWKQDMRRRASRMTALPLGSAEARELRAEMDTEIETLLELVHALPNESPHTLLVETLQLSPVPMKSESVRIQAQA